MNRRLPESTVRTLAQGVLRQGLATSGRQFRDIVRARQGAAGNTARIFRIWHEERESFLARLRQQELESVPERAAFAELTARTREAEEKAASLQARAERSELREEAHQVHWAMEVDRLREQLRTQPTHDAEIRQLRARVMALTIEVSDLRERLLQSQQSPKL